MMAEWQTAVGRVEEADVGRQERFDWRKRKGVHRVFRSCRVMFKTRASRLDYEDPDSALNKSGFAGIYLGVSMCMATVALGRPAANYLEHGYFLKPELYRLVIDDLGGVVQCLTVCVLFAYSSPLLQTVINHFHLGIRVSSLLHHTTQSLFALFASLCIYNTDWPCVQTTFFIVECIILLFKMHGYNARHIELRFTEKVKNDPSFREFTAFLFVPTFLFEKEYPRTPHIRWKFVLVQIVSGMGIALTAYVLLTEYIFPVLQRASSFYEFPGAILKLMLPMFACFICIFYLIFHALCNCLAELTHFADREFYGDWWNCTGFDEWSRKWNKPVHQFLLRHVYIHLMKVHSVPSNYASIITYVFSALLHEAFFWAVLGLVQPWVFLFMMFQIPLIIAMRPVKGTRFGTLVLWFGLQTCFPLMMLLYSKAYCHSVNCFPN